MKKKKQSLLWEISHKKSPGVSYLFGTMHIRDSIAFKNRDLVYEKILSCSAFATEFDLREAANQKDTSYAEIPDGKTLSELLKPQTFNALEKILKQQGATGLHLFERTLPILVMHVLTNGILSQEMPYSLDEDLSIFANENGKIIKGIETFDEQINILKKVPMKLQIRALKSVAKNYSGFRKEVLKTTKLYEKEDIQQLYKSTRKGIKGMRKLMLYNRNEIMAKRIGKFIKKDTLVAAIGAGHLAGEKGVIKLMKDKGFKMKPL